MSVNNDKFNALNEMLEGCEPELKEDAGAEPFSDSDEALEALDGEALEEGNWHTIDGDYKTAMKILREIPQKAKTAEVKLKKIWPEARKSMGPSSKTGRKYDAYKNAEIMLQWVKEAGGLEMASNFADAIARRLKADSADV